MLKSQNCQILQNLKLKNKKWNKNVGIFRIFSPQILNGDRPRRDVEAYLEEVVVVELLVEIGLQID